MTRNVRTYDHFCLTARTLERVGDRWSLLVIRDLLTGAKRFTDLMDRLGGITPKTLSQRLRELEDAGIVTAEEATTTGGLGAAVATLTAQHLPTHLRILGVPRSFAPTGSTAFLLEYFGLTAEHIAAAAHDIMAHASP